MDGRCEPSDSLARVSVASSEHGRDGSLTVDLRLSPQPDMGTTVRFAAAAPPERRASAEGSCLPFANETQAFEGSRAMRGVARAVVGDYPTYRVQLRAVPNAYYADLGTVRVPPAVFVTYTHGGKQVRGAAKVDEGVPFRTLTYPALRGSAAFYDVATKAARSQPDILYASAFPPNPAKTQASTPDEFWGGKPPM